MDALKIFSSPKFGQVRIITDDASGELLFCANDVTDALLYSNGRDAITRHVDKSDVVKHDTPIPNQYGTLVNQSVTYITESGVYSLIFSSKQERAKEFKHWVTSEVLPSIRKTGQYSVGQPKATLNEQLQANLTFADWAIKTLNINEASKLGWAKKISDKFGLAAELPDAVNAGTEKPITHAATDLLKSHNVGISAQAFNRMLELKGVVKHATRPGKRGKVHSWYVITPAFDKYGQNQQDPKFQQQTQIRWYDATFMELLTIVGLNSQTSLNLN
nr:MAG TPA: repressor domain protein [Caudoviricetes sp.]